LAEAKPTELILNTIEFGYVIPFFQEPVSALLKNNWSAIDNFDFVVKAISELLIALKFYLLFFNVAIHMPMVQDKPFFSRIGNCYCKRVYHVRNVFSIMHPLIKSSEIAI
jgi:hypothetical protein